MSVTRPTLKFPPLAVDELVLVEPELLLVDPEPVLPLELLDELLLLVLLLLPQAARARASTPAHRTSSPSRRIVALTRPPLPLSCGTKAKPYIALRRQRTFFLRLGS